MTDLHQIRSWSRDCHIWYIGDFGTYLYTSYTTLPKYATFGPESAAWGGGRMAWVAILYPSPHIREFFFFVSFSLITWHLAFFLDVNCSSWCSTSFWSLRRHPGMATCWCSALKAASAAQSRSFFCYALSTFSFHVFAESMGTVAWNGILAYTNPSRTEIQETCRKYFSFYGEYSECIWA